MDSNALHHERTEVAKNLGGGGDPRSSRSYSSLLQDSLFQVADSPFSLISFMNREARTWILALSFTGPPQLWGGINRSIKNTLNSVRTRGMWPWAELGMWPNLFILFHTSSRSKELLWRLMWESGTRRPFYARAVPLKFRTFLKRIIFFFYFAV